MNGIFSSVFKDDDAGALLLKTGQETSYHAGDDGDLELGVAHDYTVLTTGQHSGTTAIVINGKTCNLGNNCVKDNNTKLMWARSVPQSDIGPAANGRLFWDQWTLANKTTISFDAASKEIRDSAGGFDVSALCDNRRFTIVGSINNNGTFNVNGTPTTSVIVVDETPTNEAAGASISIATVDDLVWDFVDQANANGLGGYTDWRLPNRRELESIVDLGHCNPCIDSAIFPSTQSSQHWTSSTNPCNNPYAFNVLFSYGNVSYYNKKSSKNYGRLVRST